jgi:chemotaxis protein MotA
MDIMTLGSVIFGFGMLIIAFVIEGGSPAALLAPTAAMIVFGGTIGAIGISFPSKYLLKIPQYLEIAFRTQKEDKSQLIDYFERLAIMVRKEGLLSLDKVIASGDEIDPFLVSGLQLVMDGTDVEVIKHTLETKITNVEERHSKGIAIFESAGGYSPTMGVIGTVMGLVHVLGDLSNPGALGGKIAVAFIATLYGVGTANLFWLPIGSKLRQLDAEEIVTKYMIIDGVLMLQEGSNPTLLREHLEGYLENEEKTGKQG